MRKYIIASHGKFAEGIRNSAEMILGPQKDLQVICAYLEAGFDLKREIKRVLEKIPPGSEVIIFTDLFGGSVNNACLSGKGDHDYHLIAGINLCLLLSVLTAPADEPLEQTIESAIRTAKDQIVYCNKKDLVLEDENF